MNGGIKPQKFRFLYEPGGGISRTYEPGFFRWGRPGPDRAHPRGSLFEHIATLWGEGNVTDFFKNRHCTCQLPKSVKNDRFWSKIPKKSVFCQIWQILSSKSVKFDRFQNDRFCCQNLSKMTDFGQKSWKNLQSVKFDRFWVQNLSNLTDFEMTDFAAKICQKWQILVRNPEKICFLSQIWKNLSFLTDFASFSRMALKSVNFGRNLSHSPPKPTIFGQFWLILDNIFHYVNLVV